MSSRPLIVSDYDPQWPNQFREIAMSLRTVLAGDALRIDHIGSTSVPGLAVEGRYRYSGDGTGTRCRRYVARRAPSHACPATGEHPPNHVPGWASNEALGWAKRYWSGSHDLHVHVRAADQPNQRYPLVFRDYLRADARAAMSYAALKQALVVGAPDDWDTYYAVKDQACDLVVLGAEQWATRTGWSFPPSDA